MIFAIVIFCSGCNVAQLVQNPIEPNDADSNGRSPGSTVRFLQSEQKEWRRGRKKKTRQQDKEKIYTGLVSMENIRGFSGACC